MAGADVLSQSEIDDLLSALSTGSVSAEEIRSEEKQKKIKIYDFKRPDKFSKDQIRTLQMIHENFARFLNTFLSTQLRALIHIDVASVDQLTYEEFVRSLPNPSVITIFQMKPLKGNAILEINPNIVLAIIDRLFGGPGLPPAKARPLTDIEEVIIRKIINKTLEALQEAWKQVVAIEPRADVIETNPQFTQIVPPNDMVVIITLQTKIGQAEGLVNLCIPYLTLEPIMSKLTTTYWVASSSIQHAGEDTIQILQKKVERALIPVIIELGQTTITVQDMLGLTLGDVLPLQSRVEEELNVVVGSQTTFKCRPGVMGRYMAVQVTEVIDRGVETDG